MKKKKDLSSGDEIIATVKVEVAKPLNSDWDSLGNCLRDIESVTHHMLNRAMDDMGSAVAVNRLKWLNDPARKKPGKRAALDASACVADRAPNGAALKTLAYRSCILALDELRCWYGEKAKEHASALKEKMERLEAVRKNIVNARTDEVREEAQEEESELKKTIKSIESDLARCTRRANLHPSGGVTGALSMLAFSRFKVWTDNYRNDARSTFGKGQPIYVRAQETKILRDASGYVLTVQLLDKGGCFDLAVVPSGGSAHATMREITDPESAWRACDCKLQRDSKGKWYAIITFKRPRPEIKADTNVVLAVHFGVRNPIVIACTTGDSFLIENDGSRILHCKAQFRDRRRRIGKAMRVLGDGAKGHGILRREARFEKIEEREARFMRTTMQQWAARVMSFAERWGAGIILLDSYSPKEIAEKNDVDGNEYVARFLRYWPIAASREAVRWAAEKARTTHKGQSIDLPGGRREVVDAPKGEPISTACPMPDCLTVDPDAVNKATGVFHCKACGLERNGDIIAAFNMLRMAGYDGFSRHLARHRKLVEEMKGAAE